MPPKCAPLVCIHCRGLSVLPRRGSCRRAGPALANSSDSHPIEFLARLPSPWDQANVGSRGAAGNTGAIDQSACLLLVGRDDHETTDGNRNVRDGHLRGNES